MQTTNDIIAAYHHESRLFGAGPKSESDATFLGVHPAWRRSVNLFSVPPRRPSTQRGEREGEGGEGCRGKSRYVIIRPSQNSEVQGFLSFWTMWLEAVVLNSCGVNYEIM